MRAKHFILQINLDDQLRAVGVTYVRDGAVLSVTASKEVIISTGAIGTPQLLMLSGIGPAKHLIEHGVKLKMIMKTHDFTNECTCIVLI